MAIDSDTRKFSAMNIGCPWRGVNNVPSGALDEPEQFSLIYLYNEFAAAEAAEEASPQGRVFQGGMMVF